MAKKKDLFKTREPAGVYERKTVYVDPYSREGRRVSGYRANRYRTMRLLSGGATPRCGYPGCGNTDMGRLTIAHTTPDIFSGYETRSGGKAYYDWMKHVSANPDNYRVLCSRHHTKTDRRKIPSPRVHRPKGRK